MKIIIADADRDFCEMLESQLAYLLHDVSIKGVFDGKELVRRTEELCPDLVVVNLLLPEKDGLAAMQAIRAMRLHRQPELVVLSGYLNPHMQEELCRLRPAFFTALPCDMAVLAERIRLCCRELICRMPNRTGSREAALTSFLRELGLAMHCNGFSYIRYGLQWLINETVWDLRVTKRLYPAIAARYGTSAANVERAIRSALLSAWQQEGYLMQQELFRERPTNSEFFAVTVEYFRQVQRQTGTE